MLTYANNFVVMGETKERVVRSTLNYLKQVCQWDYV